LAKTEPPDVLLCDLGLPEMDGFEVAQTLRDPALNAIRMIAVSGYGQEEDRQRSEVPVRSAPHQAGRSARPAAAARGPEDRPVIERQLRVMRVL
jgi:CheY-like chemotaxis protein